MECSPIGIGLEVLWPTVDQSQHHVKSQFCDIRRGALEVLGGLVSGFVAHSLKHGADGYLFFLGNFKNS
jgi:hypothetical protein